METLNSGGGEGRVMLSVKNGCNSKFEQESGQFNDTDSICMNSSGLLGTVTRVRIKKITIWIQNTFDLIHVVVFIFKTPCVFVLKFHCEFDSWFIALYLSILI